MKTVGVLTTPGCASAIIVCNVLMERRARIISVNRPIGFTYTEGGPDQRSYEIWVEHELASDKSWRDSIIHEASKRWMEQQNAPRGATRPTGR
jgi:hypothetical protein